MVSAPPIRVLRTAADGARVSVTLPAEVGRLRWHTRTRFDGPRFARDFGLAQGGYDRHFLDLLVPGARRRAFRRRGFDLTLLEAADRSESCLVWAGPHHHALTRLGGPAPRDEVLNRIVSAVDFADSPSGARLIARRGTHVRQHATRVIGWNDKIIVMLEDARSAREALPGWRGMRLGDGEVWRMRLDADEEQSLAGTPHAWRYVFANNSCAADVIFRSGPEGPTLRGQAAEDWAGRVLTGFRVAWGA